MNMCHAFGCYLMSLMSLNVFVLRKFPRFFETCHFFIIFQSSFCLFSENTGQTFFPMDYIIILWRFVSKERFRAFCTTGF